MIYIPMLVVSKLTFVAMWLLSPFAVYKIATMMALEEGPFSIFQNFRNLFTQPNWIGRGVRCPSCISFWAGMVMALVLWQLGQFEIIQVGAVGLGLSGLATYLAMRKF